MDQKQLLDVAKKQQGLTSDYSLAQRLGVSTGRISSLRKGTQTADEAEILMLAEMAGIEPKRAFAAVHKDKEKNPAKRAYWEKISMQFALGMLLVSVCFIGDIQPAAAAIKAEHSINYACFYRTAVSDPKLSELIYRQN